MTDSPPSVPPRCLRPDGGCSWSHHNYKHFPAKGTAKEHTRHGPARYHVGLAGFTAGDPP